MSNSLKGFWLLPTSYALLGWVIALFALVSNIVQVNSLSLEGWTVIGYVLLVFLASSIAFLPTANRILTKDHTPRICKRDWVLFSLATCVGFVGLLKYVSDFSAAAGGLNEFIFLLFTSALDIRKAAEDTQSVGFQISYFSWISIFFGVVLLATTRLGVGLRSIVCLIVACEVLLNLTFIDRTRPTWLLVICVLGVYFSRDAHALRVSRTLFYIGVFPLALFLLFAALVGKYEAEVGLARTLVAYVVGSFGYLDSLISTHGAYDYFPVRSFYPLSKVLESIGLISAVPSQVLENLSVPFDTNVGTFVEPLLSDGGVVFIAIGVPMVAFFANFVSLRCFASRTLFGLFVWSNLVFCMLISFFVPQFNSTAIYLFLALFALRSLVNTRRSRWEGAVAIPHSTPSRQV